MNDSISGSEPKFGEWPESALRELIALKIEGDGGPERYISGSRQSRLAMVVSKLTGCSYPWAWREIERIVGGGPRSAGD